MAPFIVIEFISALAVLIFINWYLSGRLVKSLWSRFSPTGVYEVSVKPPSVKVCGTSKPTLSNQDRKDFRNLLEMGQFDPLTKAATEIQTTFESDPSYEYKVQDFFNVFATALPQYEGLLDAWVQYTPSHFAPYLARGHYYYNKAWESRGHKFAAETSSEQFRGMRLFFQKASKDIDAALAINPRLLTAYIIRIGIHNAEGEKNEEEAVFNKGRSFFPSSFLLYKTMLWSRLPRWGGSYAEMNRIAMQAFDHIRTNPELYMLFGEIYADQAWGFRKKEQYPRAIALYSKAISYGEHYSFFEERGRTYVYMKDYDKALEDANQSISLRPVIASPYRLRATIFMEKGDLNSAVQEISSVEALFPGDPETQQWRDWAAKRFLNQGHTAFKTDLEQAVARYDVAIDIKPQYAEALYWRGVAHSKLNKTDLAYSDIKQSIKYNPRHFQSYKMLDFLLASQQKWDEIVENWNEFLTLEPNNAEAYLERAGAYRHKGEMKNALADLKQACDLGKEDACKILKQYQ